MIDFKHIKPGDTVRVRSTNYRGTEEFRDLLALRVGRDYIHAGRPDANRYAGLVEKFRRDTGAGAHSQQIVTDEWLALEKRGMAVDEAWRALRNVWNPVATYGLEACEAALAALKVKP